VIIYILPLQWETNACPSRTINNFSKKWVVKKDCSSYSKLKAHEIEMDLKKLIQQDYEILISVAHSYSVIYIYTLSFYLKINHGPLIHVSKKEN
jgi:hypothetical protein